jgi:hypothetical protein
MIAPRAQAPFLFARLSLAVLCGACASDSNAAPGGSDGSTHDASAADAGADAATACVTPDQGLPSDVFCTGLYLDRDQNKHAPDAKEYKPGVVLWSDGADKRRFLYLPAATKIDTSNMDAWIMPVGTKAWKEFRVGGKLIETRLFWKRGEHDWASGTYVWDAAGKQAMLDTGKKGTILDSGYEIPTAKDCGKCHHGGADKLLGIEAVALALPTAEGVTLDGLVKAGQLSDPPATTTIKLPEDSTGKAGAALGYLHANCGMPCHSSRGLGHETELVMRLTADEFWPAGDIDGGLTAPATVDQTDIYKATVAQMPTTAAVAQKFPGALRITPGAHDKSLVWLLAHVRGDYQMPPLVSHEIDAQGTKLLSDWIDALPAK